MLGAFVDRVVQIRDGRTSTEWRGSEDRAAAEVVLLDRAGRLQIPRDYVRALGLTGRVRMVLEADHVRILPAD